jgi:hypothetical protein
MSFHSLGARLLVWRDGLPSTYEPLAPGLPFGAHAPALPAFVLVAVKPVALNVSAKSVLNIVYVVKRTPESALITSVGLNRA